jgi:hypothetical protein
MKNDKKKQKRMRSITGTAGALFFPGAPWSLEPGAGGAGNRESGIGNRESRASPARGTQQLVSRRLVVVSFFFLKNEQKNE